MRQPGEGGQRRLVESGRAGVRHRIHRDLMDLARGQGRRVQGILQAPRQGHDQAQCRDSDRDAAGRQGCAQRAAACAPEPDLERVAPMHPRRGIHRLLAPHRGLAGVELDRAAVDHAHNAVGVARNLRVMRDQHHGRASSVEILEQPEYSLTGDRVQAACRLIGEEKPRPVCQRAGDGDLLLLAAG